MYLTSCKANSVSTGLVNFEIRSKQSGNENFEEWDDLIEWEAYTTFLNENNTVNK